MANHPIDKYIIVRDGKNEHLLRIANGSARSIASSDKRLALYEALISDTGMLLVRIEVAPTIEAEAASNFGTVAHNGRGTDRSGKCGICGALRVKDGKLRGGKQRWACPNQPHGVGRSGKRMKTKGKRRSSARRQSAYEQNPTCPNCQVPLHIKGRHKEVTYYKCLTPTCPPRPHREGWSSLNLPSTDGQARDLQAAVRMRLETCNPAVRDDVVQEIMLDLEMQKIKLDDLNNDRIRGYIRSQQRLRSNPHRDVSIDAQVGNSTTTFAEIIEG